MMHDKIIRCPIHEGNQFPAFIDNGFALPPGQYCRPQTHNFYILLKAEKMRNTYRVILNKSRLVVLLYFFVEEWPGAYAKEEPWIGLRTEYEVTFLHTSTARINTESIRVNKRSGVNVGNQ
jgi:hypothetical protein